MVLHSAESHSPSITRTIDLISDRLTHMLSLCFSSISKSIFIDLIFRLLFIVFSKYIIIFVWPEARLGSGPA